MYTQSNVKPVIIKKMVYVVKHGLSYVWCTAACSKSNCIEKALEHFKVKTQADLKYKGAEIVMVFVNQIIQENNSNKSV
jgi:hypothetical protein